MRRWWQLPEGWLSPFLLLALVMVSVSSLQGAAWHPALLKALDILPLAALVGFPLGFLLAWFRRFPRGLAHLIGVLGGVAWVVQLSGNLRAVLVSTSGQPLPFLDPALHGWKDLATELLIRMLILWRTFLRGATGEDVVLFIVILAFISWMMAFLTPWFAIRSHWPAFAVGFPALVLLLNTFYAPRVPVTYFSLYIFLTLVFLVYYFWKQRENEWKKSKVRYPQEMGRGVFWTGILLSAILVLGTAFLPTTAGSAETGGFWERFIQPWREVRGTWERLFSTVSGDFEPEVRFGEFGPRFGLSGARSSPNGIAFEVRSNRSEYLRALVFDQYTGHGWNSSAELGPVWVMGSDRLPVPQEGRVTVVQEITPYLQGGNMIFAFAEPVSVSLPAVAELSADIYGPDKFPDIVAVRTRTGLVEGQPYTVVSYVSVIDKTSLRQAGRSYPPEISERYLQLPTELSQRVYELADRVVAQKLEATLPATATGEVTLPARVPGGAAVVLRVEGGQIVSVSPPGSLVRSGLVTPYDAAELIEEHLRTQYTYREDISAPPANTDAVDHFLFESKAGYCDYFASAMAVMLRTQGVPARLVRGYAPGYYDQDRGAYVVPARVAHTWVEVYFPTYTWQRFEPTAADYTVRPRRPETPAPRATRPPTTPGIEEDDSDLRPPRDTPDDGLDPTGGLNSANRRFPWAAVGIPGGLVVLGALVVGGLTLRMNRGLRRLHPAAATYERMCRWAGLVRLVPPGEQTPYEISGHIGSALAGRQDEVSNIATAYVRERFSPHPLQRSEETGAIQAWKELRWTLWGFPWQQIYGRMQQLWQSLRQRVETWTRDRTPYDLP